MHDLQGHLILASKMEWSDVLNIINNNAEDARLEFKESPFLGTPKEIAIQLVSLANRYGGRILVGIKDDGRVEGAKMDMDHESLAILNVAHNNSSPPVEVGFDHATSPNAEDVLIINVSRRKGIPHAVVDRKAAEIYKRTYYVRSGSTNRLVDDIMLQYMFEHVNDPNLTI